jgi:signal transduction histidine kinase
LAPHSTENDFVAVTREAVALLGGLHDRRTIVVDSTHNPWRLVFDHGLVLRVIQNLVSNALKFTRPNGHVQIDLTPGAQGFVRFAILDDGPGIAPEHHASIFEKFGQATKGPARVGTGLGLTFCKLVVEAHGGHIGVESEVGKGSRFWFELPECASGNGAIR